MVIFSTGAAGAAAGLLAAGETSPAATAPSRPGAKHARTDSWHDADLEGHQVGPLKRMVADAENLQCSTLNGKARAIAPHPRHFTGRRLSSAFQPLAACGAADAPRDSISRRHSRPQEPGPDRPPCQGGPPRRAVDYTARRSPRRERRHHRRRRQPADRLRWRHRCGERRPPESPAWWRRSGSSWITSPTSAFRSPPTSRTWSWPSDSTR